MEILILWIITIVMSFCMEIANDLRMFKEVADQDYIIDIKRLAEFGKQIPNANKEKKILMLIPFINIMQELYRTMQYNNTRTIIFDQLYSLDILEKMTNIEKAKYQKKPTGLNAITIAMKNEINKQKEDNTILKEEDKVEMYKLKDCFESLDLKLKEEHAKLLEQLKEKNNHIEISSDPYFISEKDINQQLTNEKRQLLETKRKALIEEKNQKQSQIKDNQKLIRKKK